MKAHETFIETCAFLSEYSWIYNFKNVKVLELKVLDQWPKNWKDFVQSLRSTEELKNMGVNSRRLAETEFDWRKIGINLLKVVESLQEGAMMK